MEAAGSVVEGVVASILNNVSALGASNQLGVVNLGLQRTIERLTTGRRINRASDDAAGLGISNKLGMDIRVASQARRNAGDGVSYLQVADGVLEEVTSLLARSAELAEQAKTGTISDSNRQNLDAEFQNILTTMIDIGQNTRFNGAAVFSGSTLTVSVGAFSSIGVSVATIGDSTAVLGMSTGSATLTSSSGASAVATTVQSALETVSNLRASMGATMQQLTSVSNALGVQVENFTAAYSQIRDANLADEVVALTRFQILSQSGTNALTQANQAQQGLLALLR